MLQVKLGCLDIYNYSLTRGRYRVTTPLFQKLLDLPLLTVIVNQVNVPKTLLLKTFMVEQQKFMPMSMHHDPITRL